MDRRGFLRTLGIGGALLVTAPQLILPEATPEIALPERRYFLPPENGWPVPTPLRDLNATALFSGAGNSQLTLEGFYDPSISEMFFGKTYNIAMPNGDVVPMQLAEYSTDKMGTDGALFHMTLVSEERTHSPAYGWTAIAQRQRDGMALFG